jgi:hypothetical protein
MSFQIREILSEIRNREVIAKGTSVKIRKRLEKLYGHGNWKKMLIITDLGDLQFQYVRGCNDALC